MRERGKEKEGLGRQMYRKDEWPDTERGGHKIGRRGGGWVDR